MTSEEITSMCVLFFLAGYDTTATALTMTAYNLALHPEIQEKLYQKNNRILEQLRDQSPNEQDPLKLVTFESLGSFEYLTACLNETLRLNPPGLFTERAAVADVVLSSENGLHSIHVKKGDILFILEAMKMENEIMAPCDGTVAAVSVTKGAAVESGTLLCVIG